MVFPPLPIILAAAIIMAVKPVIPTSPVESCLISKSPIFFNALAKIRTAVEIPNITVVLLTIPDTCPLILLKIAMEAIKSANSTVIALRDLESLSLSIRASVTRDATRIAIAAAIFSKAPAFNCV